MNKVSIYIEIKYRFPFLKRILINKGTFKVQYYKAFP